MSASARLALGGFASASLSPARTLWRLASVTFVATAATAASACLRT